MKTKKRKTKKNVILSETRVWMEDGEVKTRDLVFESECTDLTPHSTECRVVFVNGDSKMIESQEIIANNNIIGKELDLALARIAFKKLYDFYTDGDED